MRVRVEMKQKKWLNGFSMRTERWLVRVTQWACEWKGAGEWRRRPQGRVSPITDSRGEGLPVWEQMGGSRGGPGPDAASHLSRNSRSCPSEHRPRRSWRNHQLFIKTLPLVDTRPCEAIMLNTHRKTNDLDGKNWTHRWILKINGWENLWPSCVIV